MKICNSAYILLLSFFLIACSSNISINQINTKDLLSDTLIRISNWYMITPFHADTAIPALKRQDQDLFVPYGKHETDIKSLKNFLALSRKISKEDTSRIFGKVLIPPHPIKLNSFVKSLPPSTAYLASEIVCSDSCTVVLAMNTSQSCKLWLNNQLCYEVEWKRTLNKFKDEFIPVKLNKGKNFILAKVSINDTYYSPVLWQFGLDITHAVCAENLYRTSYFRHFICRSLLNQGDNLKLYTGPHSYKELKVTITDTSTEHIIMENKYKANKLDGIVYVTLPDSLPHGFYTCHLNTGNDTFHQILFYGNLDKKYGQLEERIKNLKHLTDRQKNDIDGLRMRCSIDKRRYSSDFDNQAEYWNRIRVPNFYNLEYTIQCLESGETPKDRFFLRGYESHYLDTTYFYSAHVPTHLTPSAKVPVFFMLDVVDAPLDDWRKHLRNYTSGWVDDVIDMAERLGVMIIWTNCGGKSDDPQLNRVLFKEIMDDALHTLPIDPQSIFLISNCASTPLGLSLLKEYPTIIQGIGFINPVNCTVPHLLSGPDHQFVMIHPYHDEVNTNNESLDFFRKIQQINPQAKLITSYKATHYLCPADYIEPVLYELIPKHLK